MNPLMAMPVQEKTYVGKWQFAPEEPALEIWGGSFFHAPFSSRFFTVNLMKECPIPSHFWLATQDFSVPNEEQIWDMLKAWKEHSLPLYVGCFGGKGRTGVVLGVLAKLAGHADPVTWVREHYSPKAIETPEQEQWVQAFPVPPNSAFLLHAKPAAVLNTDSSPRFKL